MSGQLVQFPGRSNTELRRLIYEEMDKFEELMEVESERGIVIVAAAQIEEYLGTILKKQNIVKIILHRNLAKLQTTSKEELH